MRKAAVNLLMTIVRWRAVLDGCRLRYLCKGKINALRVESPWKTKMTTYQTGTAPDCLRTLRGVPAPFRVNGRQVRAVRGGGAGAEAQARCRQGENRHGGGHP